jgi:hypothetical protein
MTEHARLAAIFLQNTPEMPNSLSNVTDAKIPLSVAEPRSEGKQESLRVVVVQDLKGLEEHVAAWNQLAALALEPNADYNPWLVLPAVRTFGVGKHLLFLFIYRTHLNQPKKAPELCGFFPLERKRKYKGLPIANLSLWKYGCCFQCTPLVHKDYARQCLDTLFEWLGNDPQSCSLMEFSHIAAEGPVYQHLVDQFYKRGTLTYIDDAFTRAFLYRARDADTYLEQALSSNKRRDLKRKERRLRELGTLEYVTLSAGDDVEVWIEDFLRLESCGWKGKEGTALANRELDLPFFKEAARRGFAEGQLNMLALHLNGRPIAIRCNFLSRPGSFFFKPGYDEKYAAYSPGVLLEIETIRQVHADPEIAWMDSCTDPDNGLLNALWQHRKIMHNVVMATGKGWGRFVVSALPLLRWVNRKLGRYQPPQVD